MTNALVGGGVVLAIVALAFLIIKGMAKQAGRDEVKGDLLETDRDAHKDMLDADQDRDSSELADRLRDTDRRI